MYRINKYTASIRKRLYSIVKVDCRADEGGGAAEPARQPSKCAQ